ncbi:MAG: dephospho-CoA kinase [Coprobacillus sp.]|nr:dephospho-CoA kinase [Coprobacillus sp.]
MVKVIGLTGSIAVGKSTVSRYLITHGYQVLDADILSREALNPGTKCYEDVKEIFNCVMDNGYIDRKKLGEIVFNDKQKKQLLESIIHPYVIEQLKKGIKECQEELLFLDIPLLYEIHLESLCDKVIVVYVDEETQRNRLMQRNHISKETAQHLINQQISIEKKKELGDFIIDNRSYYQELYIEIERVIRSIKDEIIYE